MVPAHKLDAWEASAEESVRALPMQYAPWDFMLRVHEAYTRFLHVTAHRRCGKTLMSCIWLIQQITTCQNWQPKGAFIGPTIGNAYDAAWAYLLHYSQGLIAKVNHSKLTITYVNGGLIKLYGSTDPDKIKGQYMDAVVLDESAQHPANLWTEVIYAMLNDKGRTPGRALHIGTVKGKNAFWDLGRRAATNPDWSVFRFPASKTNIFSALELADRREAMGDAMYNQEMELDVNASIVGAYFGEEMAAAWNDRRIISPVTYDPQYPVYVAFDLGVDTNMVMWFAQATKYEIRLLDYHEGNEGGVGGLANIIRSKNYSIAALILPHDGPHREAGSNLSLMQQWQAQGFQVQILNRGSPSYRINAAKAFIPNCVFESQKCAKGIDHLSYFKVAYDERQGVEKLHPDKRGGHDHAADAFSHLAIGLPTNAGRYTLAETARLRGSQTRAIMDTNY